ncbi:transcriptional attenuator, LytR family [Ruminococcaceae bacterium FB2012]|nr:transcriptional attenuator, LytR family [Ruminococcaceae bacterium FB2012]
MSDKKNYDPAEEQDIEDAISAAMAAKKKRRVPAEEPEELREPDAVIPEDDDIRPEDKPKRSRGTVHRADDGEYEDGEYRKPAAAKPRKSSGQKKKSGKKKKKGKWTKKQTSLFIIGILFLVLCLLGLGLYLLFSHYYGLMKKGYDTSFTSEAPVVSADDSTQSDTFDPMTEEERIKKQLENIQVDMMKDSEVFNILLVGQDLRSTSEETKGNTDVMMMISLNHKDKTITMTSFMRDIWLYIPRVEVSDRLNRAFYAGGPIYLEDTIESYFGVDIDRYIVVDFNQFITIVDALGGLDIYVTPDEANGYEGEDPDGDNTRGMQNPLDEQNAILGKPWGTDYIEMSYDIDGEVVHLNGNQALAYSRIRHVGNVDFDRTKRQRLVISEIIKKAKGASLITLHNMLEEVLPNVSTNITKEEAASLVLNVFDYLSYDVQEFRVPEDYTFTGHWIDGKSVILCNIVKNAQDLQQLIYGKTTVTEETLKKYAEYNKYIDDNGNYVDYNNGIVNY